MEGKARKKRVGLIGAGAIGTLIVNACGKGLVPCEKLLVFDFDHSAAVRLKKGTNFDVMIEDSLDDLLAAKPDLIVEAASQKAALEYIPRIVESGIELIVMSTGALLQLPAVGNRVHVPSGAIGGIDAISAATLAGVDEVMLTTRKPPRALEMANTTAQLVYEGMAEEAALRFPREMNVAATLALTVKPARVKVRVVSDPAVSRNTHEINVRWRFGEMNLRFANDPHPANPRTSALAAWSAIKLLQSLLEK